MCEKGFALDKSQHVRLTEKTESSGFKISNWQAECHTLHQFRFFPLFANRRSILRVSLRLFIDHQVNS